MRGNPRPVALLVLAQALVLAVLVLWWATMPADERTGRLLRVAREEGLVSLPLAGMVDQLCWLVEARWIRLQGSGLLVGILLLLGACEGTLRRRDDVLGGYLLRWWTTGVCLLALTPGVIGGVLLAPVTFALGTVALVLALVSGVVGYSLAAGRPSVA